MVWGPALHANPREGVVAAGAARIVDAGALTTITQSTDRAIINWQSFSNATHETVRFAQPAVTSVTLNRVVGVDPSLIQGAMQANGRLFLINPNGIVFGPGSRVDVGGLVASTLAISDGDFLRGNYALVQDPAKALRAVVNRGALTAAPGGTIALVAPIVNNEGQIVAAAGRVILAGTTEASIALDGAGLVNVAVPTGQARDVLLGGGDASDLLRSAVNNDHLREARSVTVKDGQVVLGGAEGIAVNEGTVDVSAAPGTSAGRVRIESTQATLLGPGSSVLASGHGPASAGGTVRALSAGRTDLRAGARIEARGGTSGPGGFVELSGKQGVVLAGDVDASAAAGRTGKLLIDPDTIEIRAGSGTPAPDVIYEQTLEGLNIDVELEAENSITIQDLADNELALKHGLTLRTHGATNQGDITMMDANDEITTGGALTIEASTLGTHPAAIALGRLTTNDHALSVTNLGTAGSTLSFWVADAGTSDVALVNAGGNIWFSSLLARNAGIFAAGDIDAVTQVTGRLDANAGSAATGTGRIALTQTGDVTLGTVTAGGDVTLIVAPQGSQGVVVTLGDATGGIISGRNVWLDAGSLQQSGSVIRSGHGLTMTNVAARDAITLRVQGSNGRIGPVGGELLLAWGTDRSLSATARCPQPAARRASRQRRWSSRSRGPSTRARCSGTWAPPGPAPRPPRRRAKPAESASA